MLAHFKDFDDQDRADLEYGKQLPACKRLAEEGPEPPGPAYRADWTPEED